MSAVSQLECQSILSLLRSPAGYSIDLYGGVLGIRQLEDGRWAVNQQKYDLKTHTFSHLKERIFKSDRNAVTFFLQTRKRRKLGLDFEATTRKR